MDDKRYDKRNKTHGVLVDNNEVLRGLGHPVHWARDERKVEFRKRLVPGYSELDIFGIKGCPGQPGYLDYLRASANNPAGSNTNLVSPEVSLGIKAMVVAEVKPEIEKYEAMLAELERSPSAVEKYVDDLKRWRKLFRDGIVADPDSEPIDELVELAWKGNHERRQNIALIEEEIKKYAGLVV